MQKEATVSVSDILSQHQLWLDKAKTSFAAGGLAVRDATLPLDIKRQRIDALSARIANLSQQKDATSQRFDAAISQAKNEHARLQQELSADERLLQPVAAGAAQAATQPPATSAAKPAVAAEKDTPAPDKSAKTRKEKK